MPKIADITVQRTYRKKATYGFLLLPDGWECMALELPWLDNLRNKSCIPEGLYRYRKDPSPRLLGREVIWIDGVEGRSGIQIHPGNYTRNILGCIAPGDGIRDIDGDGVPDVTNSDVTFNRLMSRVPKKGTIRFIENTKPVGVYYDDR